MVSQLMWTSCGLMSSISSPAQPHMPCDHRTPTLSPADVKAAPGGPCGKEASTCPVATVGQYKPRTRLAGCWVLQPHRAHRAPRNKSRQRGRLYSPCSTKARGKERTFPAPTPPLTCILPTTSVITTNKYSRRRTDTLLCSHDGQIIEPQKRDFAFKRPCGKI